MPHSIIDPGDVSKKKHARNAHMPRTQIAQPVTSTDREALQSAAILPSVVVLCRSWVEELWNMGLAARWRTMDGAKGCSHGTTYITDCRASVCTRA
jgi:hypothetical protein